jgi:protein ImuB
MAGEATRTLVAWVPDWPVVAACGAAGVALDAPAAVLHANRVVACSPAARSAGVSRHLRRREAQARCPSLVVLDHDPARDARAFEPVAAALDALTPRIELSRPGRCAFPTRGPSRYFGGDGALADRAHALIAGVLRATGAVVAVGVADGPFAAALAARAALRHGATTRVVEPGASAAFLAPKPVAALDRPELVDVLRRLGLTTLGAFAALPAPDVLARFGADGLAAHRLASGLDERPPATSPPPDDLTVAAELDPPAERVEAAAFVARALADDLLGRLRRGGSACTRVVVGAETEHGERIERLWRSEGAGTGVSLTAGAIADRVRWQLDGWLTVAAAMPAGAARLPDQPTAGFTRIWLSPDEVIPATGRLLGFWGSDTTSADRAVRAVDRVQGLLGPDAVAVPEWRGGRSPGEAVRTVPAAAVDLGEHRPSAHAGWVRAPWPGRVPDPSPAAVHHDPLPASVLDRAGLPVAVDGRGVPSAAPATLAIAGGQAVPVVAWAGPWPAEERWWDPATARRRARFQLLVAGGSAHLVALEGGRWWVEATYD